MLGPTGVLISETRHRRLGWTRGRPIKLADGLIWRLPVIDLALLITNLTLCHAFIEALFLAETASTKSLFSAESERCRSHIEGISLRLLKLNYELDDASWEKLFKFGKLYDSFEISSVTGLAIALSRPAWLPLAVTTGNQLQLLN